MEFLNVIMRPEVLWGVIPIVAIIMIYGSRMVNRYFEHQERLAKIDAGLDPDTEG